MSILTDVEMGRLLLLLLLVILPACIGQAHYVHNTDSQAAQQRAAQAEAARNAQQEAAMYGMMGQLNSMAGQTTQAKGPPWTSSPGSQAFVKQAQDSGGGQAGDNTTARTSSSNRAVPVKSGYTGFQAARSSTMQTRQTGSGFQPARQGETRTAQESTPEESAGEIMTAKSDAPKSQLGFMGIAPGAGSSADIQSHLGAPVKREGKGTEHFKSSGQGIAEAVVTYDDQGIVRWARIRLVNQLPPELAEIAFQVMSPAGQSDGSVFTDNEPEGWTAHYVDKGIHFYVRDGIVRDVWMTVPDQDLSIVRLD